jgi:hypothetical protein
LVDPRSVQSASADPAQFRAGIIGLVTTKTPAPKARGFFFACTT